MRSLEEGEPADSSEQVGPSGRRTGTHGQRDDRRNTWRHRWHARLITLWCLSLNVFNEIEARNLAVVSGRLGAHDISVITEAPVVKNVREIPLHQLVQSSLVKL